MMHAVLLLLSAPVASHPVPTPMHYRITLKASRNIDRSASGEAASNGGYTVLAFVSAWVGEDAGQRVAHVVIDSVTCSGTGLMSEAFDTVVGTRSRGAKYDFPVGAHDMVVPTPTISNTLTNTLAQVALMLFPNVAANMTSGATWTDSLDMSSMTDASAKNRPIVTRWRVTTAAADSMMADGDVRGTLSSSRIASAGVITGTRHLTVASGWMRRLTSVTNTQTLMAPQGATAITVGTGSTSLEIVAIR